MAFKIEWKTDEILYKKTPLIFGDFLRKGTEVKNYEMVLDYDVLAKIINEYMMEETKLNLVLFRDCVEHMSRVMMIKKRELSDFSKFSSFYRFKFL